MNTHDRSTWRFLQPTRTPVVSFTLAAILMAGAATTAVRAEEWRVLVGLESANRGSQALAFLPNELWIHAGDSIRYTYPTHERHTLTFLKPSQTRPPGFGPTFGVIVGCPGVGVVPDGSSYDGNSCVTSDVLMLPEDSTPGEAPPTYSVTFPSIGNFKFVCLIHADMTGVVHVVGPATALPHDQSFYDRQMRRDGEQLLADARSLVSQRISRNEDGATVAAGIGQVVTMTGAGSQTASLMRFARRTIVVHVGDTVVWTSLDPSINHTVTFGAEPADPRPATMGLVSLSSDGAREATISSPTDNINSGFLSPAPQDRANLAQSNPGVTRFRVTFTAPGTFDYICAVHDQLGMAGTVIVQ